MVALEPHGALSCHNEGGSGGIAWHHQYLLILSGSASSFLIVEKLMPFWVPFAHAVFASWSLIVH